MAENPVKTPLPADLPEDWNVGQIVAPTGEEVGLSHQHGYNYLMEMVNRAQRGVNTLNESAGNILGSNTLTDLTSKLPASLSASEGIRPGVTGVLSVKNGGTGVSSMEELQAMFGSGELGKYILTGSYTGTIGANGTVKIYFMPNTEAGSLGEYNAQMGRYGAIVLCSIFLSDLGGGIYADIGLGSANKNFESLLTVSSSGTVSERIIVAANSGSSYGYYTLVQDERLKISGTYLEIQELKGNECRYRVEMLLLMPLVDFMGTGGGGGSAPAIVQQAVPAITVGEDGKVTASATQAAGYVEAGTKAVTRQLTSEDDPDFVPENIKDGTTIFGVTGNMQSGTAGVSSFNGRDGAVIPGKNDYTAEMVGAVPAGAVAAIVSVTEAEYNALTSKSATTLYLIKE